MEKYILRKEDSLLLVIDIQEKLLPTMESKKSLVKNTLMLAETARTLSVPVIITEQYPKGLGPTVPEIKQSLSDAPVIEKVTFSGWIPELESRLIEFGRKQIVVVGMETHVCVFQTVRDLLVKGYRVFAVSDAVSSRKKTHYRNAIALIREMGAVVTNTETVFFDWLKMAGTPEFKALAPLLK